MLQVPRIWTCITDCSSPIKIVLVNGVPEVASESDSDEFIFKGEEEDSDIGNETTCDDIGLNYIRLTISIHLSIVRCVLSWTKEKEDRR